MANYSEVFLAFQWLVAILKADSTLAGLAPGGIYRELIPPSAVPPYVIVGHQAGNDVNTMNAFRVFDSLFFRIEAHGMASQSDTLAQAAAQIDKVLGGPPGLPLTQSIIVGGVTEGVMLSCYREMPLQLDEIISTTEQWTRFGGLYRLLIQQKAT